MRSNAETPPLIRPVRVLWLTKGLGRGGAERLLTLIAPRIDASRFQIEVAYLLPWKDAFVSRLEEAGVKVHCLHGGGRDPRWVLRLRTLIREGDFDIVHSHSPVVGAAARVVAERRRRLIHTEHNVWGRYRLPTYLVNAATYGRNAGAIAVSAEVAASIRVPRCLPWVRLPDVEVVLHGIDDTAVRHGAEARAAARARLSLTPEGLVIGTVANLVPKKDHANLLAALAKVASDFDDLTALLIGTGPLEAALRTRARELGVADIVQFLGSRDDVQELLPALDVFVLSSQHEGLPIALLEAMASGVPCVATDVGGVGEALEDRKQGLVVPAGEPALLAAAIAELLHDHALRAAMGAAGAQTAGRFSIASATSELERLYAAKVAAP